VAGSSALFASSSDHNPHLVYPTFNTQYLIPTNRSRAAAAAVAAADLSAAAAAAKHAHQM